MLRMDTILLVILGIGYSGSSSACCYWLLSDFRFLGNRRDLAIDAHLHDSVSGIYDNDGVHDAQAYGEGVEQWCSSVST